MKTLFTAAAIALTSLASYAQDAIPAPEFDNRGSVVSRAEVRGELQAALASGWRPAQGEFSHVADAQVQVFTRTRAEVRAELLEAIANGERLSYGEGSPAPLPIRAVDQRIAATAALNVTPTVR
ncbi:MAG: DUF4148 domain-containing protein [Burkholderiaceae bacterium]|nr:DUF4148 domain-containing protein [Aquabacterium sp.]NUP86259.1 DUF4148 domain-containing protein [Burkholderiaceae bacterium]